MKLYDILQRESKLILDSLELSKTSDRYKEVEDILNKSLKVAKTLDEVSLLKEDKEKILNCLTKLLNNFVIAPLTLKDDEFVNPYCENMYRTNIRYPYIAKYNDNIYNFNAFNCIVRKTYNHDTLSESDIPFIPSKGNKKVFISKGGIITGDYIEDCIIRQHIIDKACFTIQSILNIPVSVICYGPEFIYVVDHREPKLKVLSEFYNVPLSYDKEIAKKKFNIRKYKKL